MAKKQLKPGTMVRVAIAAPYHQGVVGTVEFYGTGDSENTLVLNTTIYSDAYGAKLDNKPKTLIAIDPRHAVEIQGA